MSGTYSNLLISKDNRKWLEREKKKTGFSYTTIVNLMLEKQREKVKK